MIRCRLPVRTCVETVHGYLGEFASEWNPIMPAAQDEKAHADAFDRLNGDFVGLVLFTSGSTGAAASDSEKAVTDVARGGDP